MTQLWNINPRHLSCKSQSHAFNILSRILTITEPNPFLPRYNKKVIFFYRIAAAEGNQMMIETSKKNERKWIKKSMQFTVVGFWYLAYVCCWMIMLWTFIISINSAFILHMCVWSVRQINLTACVPSRLYAGCERMWREELDQQQVAAF